jgi:hypothetical protein
MSSGIRSITISEFGYRRADVHSQEMAEEDEKEVFITLWTLVAILCMLSPLICTAGSLKST